MFSCVFRFLKPLFVPWHFHSRHFKTSSPSWHWRLPWQFCNFTCQHLLWSSLLNYKFSLRKLTLSFGWYYHLRCLFTTRVTQLFRTTVKNFTLIHLLWFLVSSVSVQWPKNMHLFLIWKEIQFTPIQKLTALIGIEKVANDISSNTVILYVLIST